MQDYRKAHPEICQKKRQRLLHEDLDKLTAAAPALPRHHGDEALAELKTSKGRHRQKKAHQQRHGAPAKIGIVR